jgi:hypothetical protein
MAIQLQITGKLQVAPLVDIHNAEFAKGYTDGLWNCLFGEREGTGPLEDSYLIDSLETDIKHNLFNGQHERTLHHSLGFYLGMIHGGVLARNGQLLRDVTTLVMLSDPDITRGYYVGREYSFTDLEPQERLFTDSSLVKCIREDVEEDPYPWKDRSTWNYATGCLLGELSVHLFPATPEEQRIWEEENRRWEEKMDRECQSGERKTA